MGKPFEEAVAYKRRRIIAAEKVRRRKIIYIPQQCIQETNFVKDGSFKIKDIQKANPDLQNTVTAFIESNDKSVLLVSGFAGSGKSTFSKILLSQQWKKYDEQAYNLQKNKIQEAHKKKAEDSNTDVGSPRESNSQDEEEENHEKELLLMETFTVTNVLPVHITLPAIKQPLTDLVSEGLALMGISTSKQVSVVDR